MLFVSIRGFHEPRHQRNALRARAANGRARILGVRLEHLVYLVPLEKRLTVSTLR